MSSTQKRGFRLPWTAERGPEDGADPATLDTETPDSTPAAVSDDLGDGPFGPVESTPPATTTDAAPAAADVPEVTPEAEMLETESPSQDRIDRAQGGGASSGGADGAGAWPTSDRPGAPEHAADGRPASPASSRAETTLPRRENPLVAGLVKAMREAAVASRAETTSRLQAESTARIEAIRASSTEQASALRKRVDEDIAAIREWSKGEMARVRGETEHRIESRRADAISESQEQLAGVEQLVEQVTSTVAAFEADMDRFFEQLLAESDPARLAALAEKAPGPPDLSVDVPIVATDDSGDTSSDTDAGHGPETVGEAQAEPTTDPLEAAAAAEAEAEATEGIDVADADQWPAAVLAAARRGQDASATDEVPDGSGHSKLLVSGLTSVAGISAFKGAVGQLPGVHSVSVSSGERGVFIFNVSHEPDADIAEAVSGLSGFAARVTEASGDSLSVSAHEPAA